MAQEFTQTQSDIEHTGRFTGQFERPLQVDHGETTQDSYSQLLLAALAKSGEKSLRYIAALALSLSLAAPALAEESQNPLGSVTVCVVDRDGQPVPGRDWSVYASDGEVYFGSTQAPSGCQEDVTLPVGLAQIEVGTDLVKEITIKPRNETPEDETVIFNAEPYETWFPVLEADYVEPQPILNLLETDPVGATYQFYVELAELNSELNQDVHVRCQIWNKVSFNGYEFTTCPTKEAPANVWLIAGEYTLRVEAATPTKGFQTTEVKFQVGEK